MIVGSFARFQAFRPAQLWIACLHEHLCQNRELDNENKLLCNSASPSTPVSDPVPTAILTEQDGMAPTPTNSEQEEMDERSGAPPGPEQLVLSAVGPGAKSRAGVAAAELLRHLRQGAGASQLRLHRRRRQRPTNCPLPGRRACCHWSRGTLTVSRVIVIVLLPSQEPWKCWSQKALQYPDGNLGCTLNLILL